MEMILCDSHGKPCFLKTGTKEGPNKGQSFYICSRSMTTPCKFTRRAKLPISFCLQHVDEMVDLQALVKCKKTGNMRRFYRCKKGQALTGDSWCGSVYTDDPKVPDKNPLKDTNRSEGGGDNNNVSQKSSETTSKVVGQENADVNAPSIRLKTKKGYRQPSQETVEDSHTEDAGSEDVEPPAVIKPKVVYRNKKTGSINVQSKNPGAIDVQSVSKKTGSIDVQNNTAPKLQGKNNATNDDDCFISAVFPPNNPKTNKTGPSSKKPEQNKSVFSMDTLKESLPNTGDKSKYVTNNTSSGSEPMRSKKAPGQSDISTQRDRSGPSGDGVIVGEPSAQTAKPREGQPPGTSKSSSISRSSSSDSLSSSSSTSPSSSVDVRAVAGSKSDQALRSEVSLKLDKQKTLLKTLPIALLTDKGAKLKNHVKLLEETLKEIDDKIAKGVTLQKSTGDKSSSGSLKQITLMESFKRLPKVGMVDAMTMPTPGQVYQYAAAPQMQTLYGGRMTSARLREVGSVTRDAIDKLHRSLETCPAADEETPDPKKLTVSLMTHQRQGLTWLIWRESQHPCGGILADDMGLGKTLTMISLILKQRELSKDKPDETEANKDSSDFIKTSASLILCPASLLHQWKNEIEARCKHGVLHTYLYHGQHREKDASVLAGYDVVLTTYGIVGKELGTGDVNEKPDQPVTEWMSKDNPEPAIAQPTLLKIGWQRVILDEAHSIKNHKSQSAVGVCRLRACARWAVTGTPIQNSLLDMFSLLRFLRCSPFDEYNVWKRQVDCNHKRLNTLMKCLLLRRTKDQKNQDGKALVALPERTSKTHVIDLSDDERKMYTKLFDESKCKISNYLQQHGETSIDGGKIVNASQVASSSGGRVDTPAAGPDKVTGTMILVILLRLRQCCSHLGLLKENITEEHFEFDNSIEMSLVDQMMDLSLGSGQTKDQEAQKKTDKCDETFESTKVKEVMRNLLDIRKRSPKGQPMKSVIVSQWTKMLDIVAHHLVKAGFKHSSIRGSVSAKRRAELVQDFNTNDKGAEVMLVSLRAGGVGLNLIGGNHLFVLDMHWNPALEQQACDRIYRVGQKRDVFIHKFVCKDTVEEKILKLQKSKASLAENVLAGNKSKNQKLTLQDLRLLFGVH